MYLHLFEPLRWLRLGAYFGLFLNWGFYTAVIIASIYFNAPSPGQTWQEGAQNERYKRSFNMTLPIASGSLFLDCYILVLPIWVVWNLRLSFRRRLGVMAIFATGLAACIASSLSIAYKYKLNHHLNDFTYWTYPVLLLALVEMCVGISCSCMPSVAGFSRYLHKDGGAWAPWGTSILAPLRSLFTSSNRDHSQDGGRSWKQEGSRIHKSNYISIELESLSTHALTQNHEMTDFGGYMASRG
ncbi:uncharacterized protein EI97DRAFT_434812 [Westerdykella ornata]|uniref:Rhodopsin domain-containing protein n=1 Tax=Westerdykella ornata TaxID=318751 RepID=A0A6A6JF85_WESOR|nr:uncharacterized protein EI97DRAFT_434812 [Westerdykella ornata]KAF2274904.1 hypothetical protein EI97DRAFT_434812 [Westerdykella ornata]